MKWRWGFYLLPPVKSRPTERLILHVSYLAQTPTPTPVILYSPECVDGAADADS
jgi:hypothetical protein